MVDAGSHIGDLAAAYVLGALDPAEIETVENHLLSCHECRQLVEAERQVVDLLPYLADPAPVPLRARRSLLARINDELQANRVAQAAEREPVAVGGSGRRLPTTLTRVSWIAAAAAAVVALAFGWNSYQMQTQVDKKESELTVLAENQETMIEFLRSQGGFVTSLQNTGMAPSAGGGVILDPTKNAALLMVEGLPRPSTGHVYVVWMVRGTEHRNAGLLPLDSTGRGTLYITLPETLTSFDSIVITEEAGATAANPSGIRMMAARVSN